MWLSNTIEKIENQINKNNIDLSVLYKWNIKIIDTDFIITLIHNDKIDYLKELILNNQEIDLFVIFFDYLWIIKWNDKLEENNIWDNIIKQLELLYEEHFFVNNKITSFNNVYNDIKNYKLLYERFNDKFNSFFEKEKTIIINDTEYITKDYIKEIEKKDNNLFDKMLEKSVIFTWNYINRWIYRILSQYNERISYISKEEYKQDFIKKIEKVKDLLNNLPIEEKNFLIYYVYGDIIKKLEILLNSDKVFYIYNNVRSLYMNFIELTIKESLKWINNEEILDYNHYKEEIKLQKLFDNKLYKIYKNNIEAFTQRLADIVVLNLYHYFSQIHNSFFITNADAIADFRKIFFIILIGFIKTNNVKSLDTTILQNDEIIFHDVMVSFLSDN